MEQIAQKYRVEVTATQKRKPWIPPSIVSANKIQQKLIISFLWRAAKFRHYWNINCLLGCIQYYILIYFRRHLLCLGVAMRAYVSAKEPTAALTLYEECDHMLLEPRNTDQTHNVRSILPLILYKCFKKELNIQVVLQLKFFLLRKDTYCIQWRII